MASKRTRCVKVSQFKGSIAGMHCKLTGHGRTLDAKALNRTVTSDGQPLVRVYLPGYGYDTLVHAREVLICDDTWAAFVKKHPLKGKY